MRAVGSSVWVQGFAACAVVWAAMGCGPAVEPDDPSEYADAEGEEPQATTVVSEQPTLVVVQCPPGSVCTTPQPAPAAVYIHPAPAAVMVPPPPRYGVHPLVRAEVLDKYPKFRKCYEKGLDRNPGLAGRVFVRMKVDSDGEVDEAFDYGSNLPDRDVVKCTVKVFKGLDFGDFVGREVYHTLDFSPTAIRG